MLNLVNTMAYCTDIINGGIPDGIGGLVHLIFLIIQVVVPILLIIWGMLDFAKSVIGGDEDKVKAGQKIFIKRLIAAIIVFLVVTIVELLISAVGSIGATDDESQNAWECAHSLITGNN